MKSKKFLAQLYKLLCSIDNMLKIYVENIRKPKRDWPSLSVAILAIVISLIVFQLQNTQNAESNIVFKNIADSLKLILSSQLQNQRIYNDSVANSLSAIQDNIREQSLLTKQLQGDQNKANRPYLYQLNAKFDPVTTTSFNFSIQFKNIGERMAYACGWRAFNIDSLVTGVEQLGSYAINDTIDITARPWDASIRTRRVVNIAPDSYATFYTMIHKYDTRRIFEWLCGEVSYTDIISGQTFYKTFLGATNYCGEAIFFEAEVDKLSPIIRMVNKYLKSHNMPLLRD